MALTKVVPQLISVANTVTSTTVGAGSGQGVSLTFDAQGVITSAANTTVIANGQLTVTSSAVSVVPDNTAGINAYKILGQVQVGGTTYGNTATNVYSVPASTQGVVLSVAVANQSDFNVNVDLLARPSNQALGNQHYIIKSFTLPAADTLILEPRLTMNATSVLVANVTGANANTSNVTVNAFGIEIK